MFQGSEEIITRTTNRVAAGEDKERVRVWPELVLRETIAALAAVIVLLAVSLFLEAPLEHIADPSFSMNPSKAPWYFLGLQELLVYFTPWIAGVAIPVLVIAGLMALPYIDTARKDKKGRVVFSNEKQIRRLFTAGLGLWIILTIIGLYFRGPNWAWQWPGTGPVESAPANVSLIWLLPVVIFLYFAVSLITWYRHRGYGRESGNIIKHFFTHLLTIAGMTVTIKIAVDNILGILLR